MTGFRPDHALRGRGRLVLVVVVLAVLLALSIAAVVNYLRVEEIQLPDLSGMHYSEAVALLRDRNLVPVSYPENVPGSEIEAVTSQTPPPGAVVRQGRRVAIGVHRPPEASRAPVLIGLTAEQAVNTAAAVNLTLEDVSYAHNSQPAGRVIRQQPEPGERVDSGSQLAIVVSRGPDQPRLRMPDLTGMPVERARLTLEELGLRSIETVATGVSLDSAGRVASHRPAAGAELTAGTPVILSFQLSAREVVPVPSLEGKSALMASRMLRAAGLTLGELHYVDETELPQGTVIEFAPSGYTLRGTPISLTVNAARGEFDELRDDERERVAGGFDDRFGDTPGGGIRNDLRGRFDDGAPEDEMLGIPPRRIAEDGQPDRNDSDLVEPEGSGRRVTVRFDPATLGVRSLLERDYDLRLVVQDDRGERTVVDRRVSAGESVSAVVVVEGDAILQTFINGVFFQAWRP